MATSKLLLVDSDARSVRVLEVSLKKAGFEVATASTVEAGLQRAEQLDPDLVVTETQLPDGTGFELCEQIRARSTAGVLFLSEASNAETKVKAINVGADVFLAKPVLVKDIIVQIQSILEKRQTDSIARRERPGNLSGTIANMGVVDLLQIMEAGDKSGIVHVSSDPIRSGGYVAEGQERGTIFFREGQVIDARLGKLRGVEAVYRMLLWDDGVFEIEFKTVSRDNVVRSTTQAILLEGMRRVDEWSRFGRRLPPLTTRLTVDFDALGRAFPEVPADTKPVLHLFDGQRSLFEVVNDAPMGDTEALDVVGRLNEHHVLVRSAPTQTPVTTANDNQVEEWLSAPAPIPDGLPSVLGRAVIPSQETPSEIMSAAELPDPEPTEDVSQQTAIPEPIRDQPSLVLSRHTVPANRAVPLTHVPEDAEPIPLTQPASPRLQIQRVSSVVATPPRRASSVAVSPPAARVPLPRPEAVSTRPEAAFHQANTPTMEIPRPEPRIPAMVIPRSEIGEGENTLTDAPAPQDSSQTDRIEAAVVDAANELQDAEIRRTVARQGSYIVAPAAPPPWPVSRAADPVRPTAPDQSESEAPTPTPEVPSDIVATRVPAAADAAGFVDHKPRTAEPTHVEVAVSPEGREELSNFNDAFFDKGQDDDLGWEASGPAWKRRAPGILMAAAVLLVIVVLAAGGRSKKEPEPEAPAEVAQPAPTPKPSAAWPKTGSEGVEIETAAAPIPAEAEGADPAAAGTPPVAAPTEGAEPGTAAPTPAPAEVTPAKAEAPKPEPEKVEPAADPEKANELVGRGAAALAREQYPQARSAFRSALVADPGNAPALAGLAQVYLDQGKLRTAKGYAWRALKSSQATPRAHLVLGILSQEEGKTDQAKRSYQRFLKYEPAGPRADEVRRILQSLP